MKRIISVSAFFLFLIIPAVLFAMPTVFPHGTTIYDPENSYNGFTILTTKGNGTILIDMNGNIVKNWKDVCFEEHPARLLPGGYVMGATGFTEGKKGRLFADEDSNDLSIVDWDGNNIWTFAKAGVHHDHQKEGSPVGYYVPGMDPMVKKGKTLILSHKVVEEGGVKFTNKQLYDDYIVEVDYEGNVIWEWLASDHYREMDEIYYDYNIRNALYRNPNVVGTRTPGLVGGDWIHINSASWVGPNKWYDDGDERFHPDNIIYSARQTNTMGIISRETGKIVWHLGPEYYNSDNRYIRKMGTIIGQHHTHVIPKGLPGEGNILIFDNGGYAGFGAPNAGSSNGLNNAKRDYSRVLEIDPITFKMVWEYTAHNSGFRDKSKFFSDYVSSAQRLPNGNTLITEGADGRIFEVKPRETARDLDAIVWEYVSPFYYSSERFNMVYRAYRYPYSYAPQATHAKEEAVVPSDNMAPWLKFEK
ncbi:MAG: aryl-sulfate sulfotransferase [Deltaproteobacteria bacterium]|nr:aryl-sulfate sulfotransferase [Deltaproteobacteria bacterium]